MRLIDVNTLKLVDMTGKPPSYAILSHRWGVEEVLYHDIQNESRRESLRGFQKIRYTCEQAKKDSLEYAWVDTCCIDKSSSAELSEAINSMFKWYRGAAACYAFLDDMILPLEDVDSTACDVNESEEEWRAQFRASKWFTRGWTLQELIASQELVFYDAGWRKIGSKIDLTDEISQITGISAEVLGGQSLRSISVAKRMSWAAKRETTREEDIAYCLMGIFDVNMPMLYGEGSKAFLRLQEEILRETDDQSLFAWRASPDSAAKAPYRGLLAVSPAEFVDCDEITPFRNLSINQGMTAGITAKGVPLTCTVEPLATNASGESRVLVGINCRRGDDFQHVVAINVTSLAGAIYLRCDPSELFSCTSHGVQETVYIPKFYYSPILDREPLLERQFAFYFSDLPEGVVVTDVLPKTANYNPKLRLLELGEWTKDKAFVELKVPWSMQNLHLFLWAFRPPQKPMAGYQASFLPRVSTAGKDVLNYLVPVKKPKEHVDYHNIMEELVSLGPSATAVTVIMRQRRVQGFDMFCIEIKPTKASAGFKRFPNVYAIGSKR